MYKTILALALIATVAFANGAAQRNLFANDDVDYILQGSNGRPMGISLVNLQAPQQEYVIPFEEEEYLTPD